MGNIGPTVITVVAGIIGLAALAVAVSKNAQTSQVLTGAGTALSSVIAAAVGPVSNTGGAITGGTVPAGVTQ
jgi:PRD1 phage membrane DNA delivery